MLDTALLMLLELLATDVIFELLPATAFILDALATAAFIFEAFD